MRPELRLDYPMYRVTILHYIKMTPASPEARPHWG